MAKDTATSPFLNSVRNTICVRHYSIRTEQAYLDWIKRYIFFFHKKRHPNEMAEKEVAEFLTYLAVDRNVAAATQNQALNALNFLYKAVLERPLSKILGIAPAKKRKKLPVVLNQNEISALLKNLDGMYWLAACLMYGSGLRLMECTRLRVMAPASGYASLNLSLIPASLIESERSCAGSSKSVSLISLY